MLCSEDGAVRFANSDTLQKYMAGDLPDSSVVSPEAALQECFFLGLRLNCGIDLSSMRTKFGEAAVNEFRDTITDLVTSGVLAAKGEIIRLTARGRLLSNEVFQRFISTPAL